MSRHVLLTGFEPFGPHTVNPSELLVRSFEGCIVAGRAIESVVARLEARPATSSRHLQQLWISRATRS